MRQTLKQLVVLLALLPAVVLRGWRLALSRCFYLAWAKVNLGWSAVPTDNQILGLIDFDGTRNIRIGRGCRIYRQVRLETIGAGRITIGDDVVLSPGTVIVAHQQVEIGSHTLIGEYCSIRDQDHRTDVGTPIRQAGYVTAPVRVGSDVWIGRGCVVLKGVTIADRAVIGANSVVTRNIPAAEIWAGAPAHALRGRITPTATVDA